MDIVNIKRMVSDSAPSMQKKRPGSLGGFKLFFVVGMLMLGGTWVLMSFVGGKAAPNPNRYQAIFLANSQVYFGKLSFPRGDYAVLRDVYYVQAGALETTTDNELDVRLVKLGSEFHEPEDAMFVAKRHILFYEDLSEDSRVTAAIIQYNSGDVSQAGGFIPR